MEELVKAKVFGISAGQFERVEDCTDRVEKAPDDDGK